MFVLGKLLGALTQPLAWVAALLALGWLLLRRRPRAARSLLGLALALLLLLGWLPLPDALLRALEQRHPAPARLDAARYAGVVVLGGATESAYVWEGHAQPALNGAAERMTAVLPLLREHPQWTLLYSGGEGELLGSGLSEAERARRFFAAMGVPPAQMLLEDRSRSTYENAVLSAQLPGVDKTRPWLLVTSAWHMPRALATFQKAGWNVTPYPVDYRTGLRTPWTQYALEQGVARWQTALHEYLGLLAYRLSGRL